MTEAGRKLAKNIHVGGEYFPAGSVPPPEVAEQIRNPKVWEDPAAKAEAEAPTPIAPDGPAGGVDDTNPDGITGDNEDPGPDGPGSADEEPAGDGEDSSEDAGDEDDGAQAEATAPAKRAAARRRRA